jgi:magnesium transporter
MLKRYTFEADKIIPSQQDKSPIMVFVSPTEQERNLLIHQYDIDSHTLSSALDPDEQARLEFDNTHMVVIFKFPKNYSGEEQLLFKSGTMGVFVFKENLIVVMNEEVNLFNGKQIMKAGSFYDIVLRLINRSIFHFLEHLKVFNMIADELEKKINQSMENKYLLNLFTLEKSVVYYLNSINSNGGLIERLKYNAQKIGFDANQLEFLDNIQIENGQCYKQAEIYSNILASLMDARVSIVSNNLNVLMKTLNIITIGIMVPTLVVSAFSMNVKIPLQSNYAAFWIILSLAVISVLVFLGFWKSRKWF